MKVIRLLICLHIVFFVFSCKSTVKEQKDKVYSRHLQRYVDLTIVTTAMPDKKQEMNLLLFNDSKWLEKTRAKQIIDSLHKKNKIQPVLLVAISGQQGDYGLEESDNKEAKNYKKYNDFVINELYPFVKKKTVIRKFNTVAICGFGASGLNSFDIAWNNDNYFDAVGVFSGSFWWRKKDLKAGYTDDDRLLHEMIRETKTNPALKFWLMTGTNDELADRNHNFIIDSIDDTIDVVKELMKKGYQRPHDIFYYEMVGGKHDVSTWGKAMPAFLTWAFGK